MLNAYSVASDEFGSYPNAIVLKAKITTGRATRQTRYGTSSGVPPKGRIAQNS